MSVRQEEAAPQAPQAPQALSPKSESHARNWRGFGWGFVVKLLLMAVVNAFGIMAAISAVRAESWLIRRCRSCCW